ncbi:MAG: HAMP domain-containing protein [Acidobacteriota bacterium]|nr:HAMP domain-containing protein [Acidobacteriota bacterium]
MRLRLKLFLISATLVAVSVVAVAWAVSTTTRRAYERAERTHTDALVAQFEQEYNRRGQGVSERIAAIKGTESVLRMVVDLSRPGGDTSLYVNEAAPLAASQQLDFLDLLSGDGTIISSASWPARFGYKENWVLSAPVGQPFLHLWDLPDGNAVALTAVAVITLRDKTFYLVGGQRLDRQFLASLALPEGMRALLYLNTTPSFAPANLVSTSGGIDQPEPLAPIIEQVRQQNRAVSATVQWTNDLASTETFYTLPLAGPNRNLLAVLLVGSSQRNLVLLVRRIRLLALAVGAGGLLIGLALSWWAASRVAQPVLELAEGAREVAAGRWDARVEISSRDEVGELARSFNQMTAQLVEQRERLVQAERVAAWRELARRLAHELKNPLFPLQITVENMQRARQASPEQFDEVFRESTGTLLAELDNLKTILNRFGDFAKMPAPERHTLDLNELVRGVVKLFEAQFAAPGRAPIRAELKLDDGLGPIQADPTLLRRAVENLVLNALDAMPEGGTLTLSTARRDGAAELVVSDTGKGLTPEERDRLFTPYYTTKQHGTGLGLAIVQSVVSDHGGKISVESVPDRGTTFRIVIPGDAGGGNHAAGEGERHR